MDVEQQKSTPNMLREVCLSMSAQFHSSPAYWLDMPLVELAEWTMVANELIEKENAKYNKQKLGPGL